MDIAKRSKDIEEITTEIADIFRCRYWDWYIETDEEKRHDDVWYLLSVIASLHNLLYEKETGERYDYMFHWANKQGGRIKDNVFDLDYKPDEEVD